MTASYTIRKLAENDLEQIWLYTFHEWGIEQADKYIRMLLSRFLWLSKIHNSVSDEMTLNRIIIVFQKGDT